MKSIWAPWRSAYILGTDEPEPGCILCSRAHCGKGLQREMGVLFHSSHSYVMLNKFPYTGGHLMVVPNHHVADMDDLTEEEYLDLMNLVRTSVRLLRRAFSPHGFNVGINLGRVAGAGIDDHIHIHVVPRWNGDNNFMPVVADTRVVSQSLEAVYDALAPLFQSEPGTVR